MREITKLLIKKYELQKLKYDFMGYTFNSTQDLSFHHYLIPKKDSKSFGIGDGYIEENGVILNGKTSHPYLHKIEEYERRYFMEITYILHDIKYKEKITKEDLIRIREVLLEFEYKHRNTEDKKGNLIIKKKYINERVRL